MRVFSFGGGVQSTAALVLAARGELEVDAFLFANVGDDSENPDTLRYVREVAKPYARAHSLDLIEVGKTRRMSGGLLNAKGKALTVPETLYERLTRPGSKSIGIPVRLAGSGAPAQRNCTIDFKIRVISGWCRRHGATKANPATSMLGISQDEWHRARTNGRTDYTTNAYPLLSTEFAKAGLLGMLRPGGYTRADCIRLIEDAGLPVPPKSSCWFCPFHRLSTWQQMRDEQPDLFAKACELEASLTARAKTLKRTRGVLRPDQEAVYFTSKLVPLAKAVGDASQPSLFGGDMADDACESGYCMV